MTRSDRTRKDVRPGCQNPDTWGPSISSGWNSGLVHAFVCRSPFCTSLCLPTFLGKVSLEKTFLFQVNQSFLPATRKVTGRRNKPVCQKGQASCDIQDPNQRKWQKGLHWFLSNKHHFQDNRQGHRIRAGGLCSPGDTKLH